MRTIADRGARVPTTQSTDGALWRRAAEGDHEAFGELFERHVEAVWNHAHRLTGSWAAAEDLASSAFLTAWRKRVEVTLVRDSALPWLYAVVGNLARSEFRGRTRFLRAVRRSPVDTAEQDHADAVGDRVDQGRRMAEVAAAVRGLPAGEREAVQLCLLGELSSADAAAVLDIAESSVRARLSRARAKLRTVLGEEGR